MKIRSRLLIRTLAKSLAVCSRGLFRTVDTQIQLACPGTSPYDRSREQRYLYCVWHDSVLVAIFSGRCPRMAALVSQHADGSYVADALDCVGIVPVRGSSSRGGAAAVRQMMDACATWTLRSPLMVPVGRAAWSRRGSCTSPDRQGGSSSPWLTQPRRPGDQRENGPTSSFPNPSREATSWVASR